jgi:putative oxidoreductase
MDKARVATRVLVGSLFVGHGTQKLFGWLGGSGPQQTGEYFENLGLRPGRRHAIGAGAAEAAGGALLVLGLLTPLAGSLLTGVMTTAIRKVHAKNGVWVSDGGFEYNAVLIAALAALVEDGPGRPSADARLLPRMHGFGWALASLGAGAAGSFLLEELFTEKEAQPPTPAQAPPTEAGDPSAGNGPPEPAPVASATIGA